VLDPSFVVFGFGPPRSCLGSASRLSRLGIPRSDSRRLLELVNLVLAQTLVGILR